MKKKGFTLIELLAVIVILAIIALIATPLVLKYIEKARRESTIRSAETYVSSVEKAIVSDKITNTSAPKYNYCKITDDGNLLCNGTNKIEISIKGDKPTAGTVNFKNNQVNSVEMVINNKNIIMDSNGKLVISNLEYDVPVANENIVLIDKQVLLSQWSTDYSIFNTYTLNKSLDNVTSFSAKLTYENGKEEDVTFYYSGLITVDEYPSREHQYQVPRWTYYVNGNVVDNGDGSYSGDSSKGYINLIFNSYYEWDFDEVMYNEGTATMVINDVDRTTKKANILNDLRKINCEYFDYNYEIIINVVGSFYEEGQTEKLTFYENAENVTKVIVTYTDLTQVEYKNTTPDPSLVQVGEGLDSSPPVFAISFQNEDSVFYIMSKLNYKPIKKVTIEEKIDGELKTKSFNIVESDQLPIR